MKAPPDLEIDSTSPVPLYHQIAEALRAAIEAGTLAPGEALQPMRQAAERWGVNVHTVRHAYAALAREGLVERSRGPRGTRVASSDEKSASRPDDLASFLARVRREASERFGLGSGELAALLGEGAAKTSGEIPKVYVVECSEWQCLSHAFEIGSRYRVEASPWPLDLKVEPPEGTVISTYFHYNDVRRLWPRRLSRIHFLTIAPDPNLRRRLSRSRHVIVCERDESTVATVAADLEALLADDRIQIEKRVVRDPAAMLRRSRKRTPVLFAPRVWATLSDETRANPRALELRYVFEHDELAALGQALGWEHTATAALGHGGS